MKTFTLAVYGGLGTLAIGRQEPECPRPSAIGLPPAEG